ncbi:alkaline phosphatase [Suicoccus acidiformans]|uniref:Alkaline phosphatase n=1 Tax=Suicoccus acidiformans TaxID=2036206 RepID=A0A347WHN9_9LACT|nr:alkaline phosphatase [Suicoccus acidiformans]AXY24596.1 alkaline phosphatase [Suicoccus acidiformans]
MKKSILMTLATSLMLTSVAPSVAFAKQEEGQHADKPVVELQEGRALTEDLSLINENEAKYVFLFIGDGMGNIPVSAAEYYLGPDNGNEGFGTAEAQPLNFSQFPVIGLQNPTDADHYVPDSAATATAFGNGVKVDSNVIGLTLGYTEQTESIAEKAKADGKSVGILSTVTLNHATPAAFYANVEHRRNYYEIGEQMALSDFDYFAGGSLSRRTGDEDDQKDLYEILEENEYTVAETQEEFEAINAESGKVYAPASVMSEADGTSMKYAIDREEGEPTFADMVSKGIEVLSANEEGFFMMAESGKIDWAEHANDAATTVKEVIDFQNAIQEAIDFYYEHPEDTLIVVTADHPTGGFTIGNSETGYNSYFHLLDNQKVSQEEFDVIFDQALEENPEMTFEDFVPVLEENFGFVFDLEATEEIPTVAEAEAAEEEESKDLMLVTPLELEELKYAFEQSKLPEEERNLGQADIIKGYHSYKPISIASTRLLARKAGLAFTTVDHSPERVPVYAIGAGAAMFEGNFENIDIAYKLLAAMGLYEGGDTASAPIAVTGKASGAEETTEEVASEEIEEGSEESAQ